METKSLTEEDAPEGIASTCLSPEEIIKNIDPEKFGRQRKLVDELIEYLKEAGRFPEAKELMGLRHFLDEVSDTADAYYDIEAELPSEMELLSYLYRHEQSFPVYRSAEALNKLMSHQKVREAVKFVADEVEEKYSGYYASEKKSFLENVLKRFGNSTEGASPSVMADSSGAINEIIHYVPVGAEGQLVKMVVGRGLEGAFVQIMGKGDMTLFTSTITVGEKGAKAIWTDHRFGEDGEDRKIAGLDRLYQKEVNQ